LWLLRSAVATRVPPARVARAVVESRLMTNAEAVADRLEAELAPIHAAASRAAWEINVLASSENEARRIEMEQAVSDFLADGERFALIEAARSEATGSTRRRLDLLRAAFLANQVPAELRRRIIELEAAVEMVFSTHRGVVSGRRVNNNEILEILRGSNDGAERREAWEASKTVGAAVADDVRELARLRNAAARAVGYRDWFALSLALSEMDETKLFATLDEVDAATAEPFARWKLSLDEALAARFGCATTELAPWHYADPFFQEVPVEGGIDLAPILADGDTVALSERTFTGIGLETRPVLDRSDLFPRDDKCQHAFCIDIDREGDVRVLANVVPGQYWLDTMLHELGHATFDGGIDPTLPWMLRDCHTLVTEGIAILMGRLAGDAEWLERVLGTEPDDVAAIAADLRAARAAEMLVFARWVLVMTNFERSLYADPDSDLDARWWELVERYQLIPTPAGRSNADWAAKIHVACTPVYYHCYLYGHLVASQLSATLERECGGLVDRPAAGALLRERVFRPGQSMRWDRLLEQATGEPLTATHFGHDIGAA
jgi:peptidyl-dipeptidase A